MRSVSCPNSHVDRLLDHDCRFRLEELVKILLEQSRINLRHLHDRVRFRSFVERHDDRTDVVEQPPDADTIGMLETLSCR